MSTHGCLLVKGEDPKDDMLLHTFHTGMEIPIAVRKVPPLLAAKRFYIENKKAAKAAIRHDGNLGDWMWYPKCFSAAVIAASPCLLCHVKNNDTRGLPKWSGADEPFVIQLDEKSGTWALTNEDKTKTVFIDPMKEFIDRFPDGSGQDEQFINPNTGPWPWCEKCRTFHLPEVACFDNLNPFSSKD